MHNKSLQTQISSKELLILTDRLAQSNVLIAGDIMLDHYQYGRAERISPEAPVPIVRVEHEEYKLGGAGNVAQNINSLGAKPYLLAKVGQDRQGEQLKHLLLQNNIANQLLTSNKWKTTVKTRIVAQGQQVVRVDKEQNSPGQDPDQEFGTLLSKRLKRHKTLLISDYGKGCIDREVLNILTRRDNQDQILLLDPKEKNYHLYPRFDVMTPNVQEASWFSGLALQSKSDILSAGDQIFATQKCSNLLITLGPEGMVLFFADSSVWKIPAATQKVFDVTGAGDTVIALLAAALDVGGTMLQGCVLANAAAALVVGQVGTACVNRQELQKQLQKEPAQLGIEQWR